MTDREEGAMITKYILCVARNGEGASRLHEELRKLDCGVITCASLEQATRIIKLGRPRLVLLESADEIMDGVPLLAEFLADRWPGAPVLVEEAGRPVEETLRRCRSMLGLKD